MPSTTFTPIPPAIKQAYEDDEDVLRRLSDYLETNGFPGTTGGISIPKDTLRVDFQNASDEAAIRTFVENWNAAPSTRELREQQIMQAARNELVRIKNKGAANWTAQDALFMAMAMQLRELKGSV